MREGKFDEAAVFRNFDDDDGGKVYCFTISFVITILKFIK